MPPIFNFSNPIDEQQFSPKGKRGIDLADKHDVNGAFNQFKFWNRLDLIESLAGFMRANGQQPSVTQLSMRFDMHSLHRLGERGKWEWTPTRAPLVEGPPLPLQGHGSLIVHRGSVIAFLDAEVGHSFTGVVRVLSEESRHVHRPKIFLMPVQPSVRPPRTSTDSPSVYAIRPHDPNKDSEIYGQKYKPITHQQSGLGQASHTQLTEMVTAKPKWSNYSQERGLFIGFTIMKGSLARGMPNRYGFTSASSNSKSFRLYEGCVHPLHPTEPWAMEIKFACDKLLEFEQSLFEQQIAPGMLKRMSKGDWKNLRGEIWGTHLPAVRTQEAVQLDTEDDWDTDPNYMFGGKQ